MTIVCQKGRTLLYSLQGEGMSSIRTAVIGFGLSGKIFHSPFLDASDRFELSTVLQRNDSSALEEYPGVRLARSLDQVLDDDRIDLVVITTPNSLHYPMAKEALLAGKHVVVEKPFAPTAAECNELIDLARQQERHLFVFHNRRWDGDFMTVRKIVDSGVLGDIVSYEAHYDRYAPVLNPKPWKETANPSISVLHDLGTHIIDQVVCLFGVPEACTAHLRKEREGSIIHDAFDLVLDYPNLQAVLRSSLLVREVGPRYTVHGRNGSFVKFGLDPQEDDMKAGADPLAPDWGLEPEENWGTLNTSINGLNCRGVVQTLPGNYMLFYDNVAAVIRNGGQMAIRPEEALITVRVIEAAQESHAGGRTVSL